MKVSMVNVLYPTTHKTIITKVHKKTPGWLPGVFALFHLTFIYIILYKTSNVVSAIVELVIFVTLPNNFI